MAKVIIEPIMGNDDNFKIKIIGKFGNNFIVKPKVYEVIQENNDTTIKLVNTFDKTVLVSGYQIADFEVEGNIYTNIEDLTQAISIAVFKKGGGGSGSVSQEVDPVFKASPASSLTSSDLSFVKNRDYNDLNNVPDVSLKQDKTDNALDTTDKTIVGSINELNTNKQNLLVSGTTIKTIEGQSILGNGNIDLNKSDVGLANVDNTSDLDKPISTAAQAAFNSKQDILVSGTNIKTINNTSLLGSGNLNLIGSKNEAGQVKVDYIGLYLINFATNVEKQFNISSAFAAIAPSPTTTYPFSTPNDYSGIFDPSRNGGTSAFPGRLIENPKFGQSHAWRIIGTYSNKSSGNTGELVIGLKNPVSGFATLYNITLPNGTSTGSFSVLLYTIADSASITPPNGYILTAQASFADNDLNIIINSITRFSNAIDN